MRRAGIQAALLSIVSMAAVGPLLWKRGTDVVTRTYSNASFELWAGRSPYLTPQAGSDWFKYSPVFALLYRPFSLMGPQLQALTWAFVNALVFWMALSLWVPLSRKTRGLEWVALAAAAAELDISLRYQQTNALMAGLAVAGLWLYRERRLASSAVVLAFISEIKILPVVFLGALLWPLRRRYFVALALTLLALFLVPACRVSVGSLFELHGEWLRLVARDFSEMGLLDVRTALGRAGWPGTGDGLRLAVIVVTVVLFAQARLRHAGKNNFDWGSWYAFGACALLLLSPRTESPTFVLAAPAYVLVAEHLSGEEFLKESLGRLLKFGLVVAMFFVSFAYTDLWPKALWNPAEQHYLSKVLGTLLLWVISGTLLALFPER